MIPPQGSPLEPHAPGMPPPADFHSQPGGLGTSLKYGVIFGLLAAVPDLLQVVIGTVAVRANESAIAAYQGDYKRYQDCIQAGGSAATCTSPPANVGIVSVFLAGYGTCCLAFLITLVLYLFAGRAAARAAGRRGPGIWAALVAALAGSLLYIIFSTVAAATTGRSALAFGLSTASTAGTIAFSATAGIVGLLVAVGCAALLGWWGAALGAPRVPAGWNAPPMAGAYGSMPPYPAYLPHPPIPGGAPAPGAYPPPGFPPYPLAGYPPYPPAPGGYAPDVSPGGPVPPASPPVDTP